MAFTKQRAGAPTGFFQAEAAGLRWLAEPGVIPVVRVLGVADDRLELERLESAPSTPEAARTFGAQLACLHSSGAPGFGWAPHSPAYFGPLSQPFEVPAAPRESFGKFWTEDRLRPLLESSRGQLGARGAATVEEAVNLIAEGAYNGIAGGPEEEPARVHGDLWNGNVMWTADGAVLIDPAAHSGHRLEDLAMLAMFGAPHLGEIYAGYESEHPMPSGWRDDIPAHQLFGLLAHVHLFGSMYTPDTVSAAEEVLRGR